MAYSPYPAGLLRRLAAAVYDLFLLFGLWLIGTLVLLPFSYGHAAALGHSPFYRAYLLYIPFLYFGWFWTHGGQTLGMLAWRMRLRSVDDQPVGWMRSALRYVGAWFAWLSVIGMLWIILDPQKRGWQDMLSKTEIMVLPKAR